MTLYEKVSEGLQDRILAVVAKRTGISAVTLSNVKNGIANPNKSTLNILANYLKIDDDVK